MIDKKMPSDIRISTQAGGEGDLYAISLMGVYHGSHISHVAKVTVAKDREDAERQAEQMALEEFPDADQRNATVSLVLVNWNIPLGQKVDFDGP